MDWVRARQCRALADADPKSAIYKSPVFTPMPINETRRLQVGDMAPHVTVLDQAGQPFDLQQAWQAGPVVLTFLRHFG